jgi:carnosine N-methyltransferase
MDNSCALLVLFLQSVLTHASQYAKVAHYNTTHLRRQNFYALPQEHWQLLAGPPFSYLDTLNAVDDAIDKNAELAMAILRCGLEAFGFSPDVKDTDPWRGTATSSDLEKARSTLRQLYRDWSQEGRSERKACYEPVLDDLCEEKDWKHEDMKVLVPGAGLGRLVFELCYLGFHVEGNEISYHQLLASNYILNHSPSAYFHTIYPWAHGFSNHNSREKHLQAVRVPDLHPGTEFIELSKMDRAPGEMSMSAADFLELYSDPAQALTYDAVATVFFLDTAPNPIRYIQTIHNCLKRGGIWTNLGPLLWHFENDPPGKNGRETNHSEKASDTAIKNKSAGIADPGGVELTDDEVIELVKHFGFVIEKRESGLAAGYIQDTESMLQSTYKVSHWIARKL